jgi:hypothetical protein
VNLSGLCRPPAIFQLCFTAVGVSHQQNHSAAVLYAAVSATWNDTTTTTTAQPAHLSGVLHTLLCLLKMKQPVHEPPSTAAANSTSSDSAQATAKDERYTAVKYE